MVGTALDSASLAIGLQSPNCTSRPYTFEKFVDLILDPPLVLTMTAVSFFLAFTRRWMCTLANWPDNV